MSETVQLVVDAPRTLSRAWLRAVVALAKPRITAMVLVATSVGFYMAVLPEAGAAVLPFLFHALVGTALVTGGANALNQYLEADFDRLMPRTEDRPIPSGRVTGGEALAFAFATCLAGGAYLTFFVNGLAAAIGAFAVLSYAFVYTPLKRITPLCVFVGAIPGALPPVIGWAAGAGEVGAGAWLLFATMFFWQLPHFAAIAWLYREDYAAAGYPMLAVIDEDGTRTNIHVVTHSVGLIAASLLPTVYGITGTAYGAGALVLGVLFLAAGVWFIAGKRKEIARVHLLGSVSYLPLLFGLMVLDKVGPR